MPNLVQLLRTSPWITASGGNFAVKLLSLAASVILARFVGPTGRGVITAETLWSLLVINFASVVVVRCVVYFGGRFGREGAWRCIRLATVSGVALALVVLLINRELLIGKASYLAANIYAMTVPFSLIVSAIAALHLLDGNFGLFWVGEAVTAGCTALGVIVVAASGMLTPVSYAVIALVAVITSLVVVIMTARKVVIRATGSVPRPFELSAYAVALGATLLPFQINSRIDQLLVSVSAPMRTLGYYSIASAWASMLSMLGAGFSTVILAESAKIANGALGDVQSLAMRVRRATVVLAIVCLVTTMATPIGIPLLYGSDFAPAIPAAVILSLASLFLYYNSLLHEVARGTGRPIIGWLPETAGLAASLGLLKLLYFRFGMVGAALSSILSYFIVSTILLYELRRSDVGLTVRDFIPTFIDVRDVVRAATTLAGRTLFRSRTRVSAGAAIIPRTDDP